MLIMTLGERIKQWICCRNNKEWANKQEQGTVNSVKSGAWKIVICFILFAITKRINYGVLGFADVKLANLPASFYTWGDVGNFFGFTEMNFYSTDYFSLFPWFFLFLAGYFLHKWFVQKEWMDVLVKLPSFGRWWRPLGKYSLLIYMLHQPVIYGILYILA